MRARAPEAEPTGPDRVATIVKAVSGIASTLALLTALLYYFGWVRSEAQARAFGADASVFGMSTQELVIRSADVLFVPLVAGALGVVGAVWAHRRLVDAGTVGGRHRAVRRLALALRGLALASFVAATVLLAVGGPLGPLVLPFLFAAGVGAAWYAHELTLRLTPGSAPTPTAMFLALAAVLAISLFWMAERAARIGGEAGVAAIQSDLSHRLGPVAVTTATELLPAAEPVRAQQVGTPERPLVRYEGLYLLQRSGGSYFFVTDGWQQGKGRLFAVPESAVVGVEFHSRP